MLILNKWRAIWQAATARAQACRCGGIALGLSALLIVGCYALKNHPLDPSQVGDFTYEGTQEIRTTLSLQDTPEGIPGATDPNRDDLKPTPKLYHFSTGDTVLVRVFELLSPGTETPTQSVIDERGEISLPVVGRFRIAGMTAPELEDHIKRVLAEKEILKDAQVIVEPLIRRKWAYTLFGAISAPNLYPLTTPEFKLMEALNVAGGLADAATDVYIFRETDPTDTPAPVSPPEVLPVSPNVMESYGNAANWQDPATATQQALDPETTGDAASLHDIDPSAPDTPYIFVNHEWVPTQTPSATATSQTAEQVPLGTIPGDGEPSVDWAAIAGDEPGQRIIHLSADRLRDGDPRENIVVRPGDIIRVFAGTPGEYFMMGQIARPGAYSLTGRQVTLMQAVAAAGGLGPLAWPTRCTVYRRYGDRREMKQVDLDRVFAGRDSDLNLKKDDIIVVGTHPAAPFLAVIRNAFRMTYGFGFVYDRNFADIDSFQTRQNPETVERFNPRFPDIFGNTN